jgi:hypothetical protein
MPKFFLNYGGPDNELTSNPERIAALDKACQREYTGAVRSVTSMVKGVQLTVHTYGIHRALTCEIPNDATPAVRARYELALYTAERDILRPYDLVRHNCVTSVATILNGLDSGLTSANVVSPWTLDANLKEYCGDYEENSAAALFINEYQKTMRQERFSLLRIRTWTDERIESVTDIIKHSYGRGKEGSGERTKSTLIKLGWVTEDKKGTLIPSFNAPAEFSDGLNAYNEDFARVQHLKSLYKKEASVFSFNKNHFFDDNPDYQTALARLEAQERRHPHGASAKVLKIIAAEAVVNPPHEKFRQRERETRFEAPSKEERHNAKDDSPSISL